MKTKRENQQIFSSEKQIEKNNSVLLTFDKGKLGIIILLICWEISKSLPLKY